MFIARRETLSQCLPDIKPLLEEHWKELAKNQDVVKLSPRWETYDLLEKSGALRMYVVRNDGGEMAGYAGFLLHKHLHYEDHLWAVSDLFFVRSIFRRKWWKRFILWGAKPKGAGTVLFEAVEADLRASGASVINVSFKISNPAAGKMLAKLGYGPIELVYSKLIK